MKASLDLNKLTDAADGSRSFRVLKYEKAHEEIREAVKELSGIVSGRREALHVLNAVEALLVHATALYVCQKEIDEAKDFQKDVGSWIAAHGKA